MMAVVTTIVIAIIVMLIVALFFLFGKKNMRSRCGNPENERDQKKDCSKGSCSICKHPSEKKDSQNDNHREK